MTPADFADHFVDVHGLAIAGYEQPGMVPRTTGGILSLLMMTDPVNKILSKEIKDKSNDGISQTEEELSRTKLVAIAARFDVSPYRERYRKKSRAQLFAGIAEAMQDGVILKPSPNLAKEKEDVRERALKAIEGMSAIKLRKLPKFELVLRRSTRNGPSLTPSSGAARACRQAPSLWFDVRCSLIISHSRSHC